MSSALSYTHPAHIDGEPKDVRELSLQQLGEALAQVAMLTEETLTQLRAEGVGRLGEDWDDSDDRQWGAGICRNLQKAIKCVNRLQQAE